MSVPLAVSLAELRGPLEQSYRNTAYCSGTIEQVDNELATRYCGNRWCLVCNRIRTARAINSYFPILETWDRKQLVTLTVPNVPAIALRGTIERMIRRFQDVKRAMRRTDKTNLIGLRKLECTYNAARDDYHPHFHVVVKTPEMARLLHDRWLEQFPEARAIAQDIRACDNGSLHEVFKYFTKLLTKTRHAMNAPGKTAPVAPAALDVIFRAMKRLRVYQSVGFTIAAAAEDADAETLEPVKATAALTRLGERVVWEWSQAVADWIAKDSGEVLSGYEPGERFAKFVKTIEQGPPAEAIARVSPLDEWSEAKLRAAMQERLRDYTRERAEWERREAAELRRAPLGTT